MAITSFKDRMYYQLIISILHSKRQKSDYVDSVQIRKGNNLTYLTFDYIKNYQIVFEQECFNRTQNVTNKSYQMIFQRGRGETTIFVRYYQLFIVPPLHRPRDQIIILLKLLVKYMFLYQQSAATNTESHGANMPAKQRDMILNKTER